jgi:hypothetical protein
VRSIFKQSSLRARHRTSPGLAIWAVALAAAAAVNAEPVGGPEALDSAMGHVVRVTLQAGHEPEQIEGRLHSRSEERLELDRRGHRISIPIDAIARVELLPKGRLGGTVVGTLAWGALAFAFYKDDLDTSRAARVGEGMIAGAAIGALWDWRRREKPQVLYER